jgi:glycerophosphoryl diester phosphodiesterase
MLRFCARSVSAHRGGTEHARPATYEAYEHAVTTGAEYAEFDIRRAGDGALVVWHDAAAGAAAVGGLDYQALCAAAGYRVPLVTDVLALLARGGVAGHLDLKETGYETEVTALALAALGPEGFVVTTLEDQSVRAIRASFPQVRTALSLGRDLAGVPRPRWAAVRASELVPLGRIRRCGAAGVAVNYQLARMGVTRACAAAGLGVMVWTVDSDRQLDEFLRDERVDVVITNRPGRALERRAALRRPA